LRLLLFIICLKLIIAAEEAVAAQSMKFQRIRMQFVEGAKGKIGEKRQEGPQLWDDSGKGFRQASLSPLELISILFHVRSLVYWKAYLCT
jgi:hypothetical protein